MKVKKVFFTVSDYDQNILYRVYEEYDFHFYLDQLSEFAIVEKVNSPQMGVDYYRYKLFLDSEAKRRCVCNFGMRLIEFAGFELAKSNLKVYSTCQSLGRKLLKCLV